MKKCIRIQILCASSSSDNDKSDHDVHIIIDENYEFDFDKDSARFFISCQKIILISIILNKQLKTTFNSIT